MSEINRHMTTDIRTKIERAKALVLDFDGTLVDSNDIKRNAFEKCFVDYPERFEAIMAYCKGNNHIPRHVKFRHAFENILKLPYTAGIEKQMLETYAAQTTSQVIAAKEIPGATKFLEKFYRQKELALLSSTPHETLLHILDKRGMKKYFGAVQGAPVDKSGWLKKFIADRGLKKEEVAFIGDSFEDLRAAKEAQIFYIGVGLDIPHFNEI